MSDNRSGLLQKIQSSYLNPDGADVWFDFDDDRVPGHKFILTATSPWLNTMFNGSLPETGNVDMINSEVTVAAFKEFLQFFYLEDVTLTMDNIEGVIHLAKQSLSKDIFAKCEQFLIRSLTMDKMFYGYQLALLYEADELKAFCENEICVNAEATFKSSSFLDFPYSMLKPILECDSLVCEEKDIFDACIAWAKAACDRNQQVSTKAENLRAQLKDLIYQIRFSSMTKEEAAACIRSCHGLFTATELEEIMCMVGRASDFQVKKFNWTPRYYNPKLNGDRDHQLLCCRYKRFDMADDEYAFETIETLALTCNRCVILNGFYCESTSNGTELVTVTISEVKSTSSENVTERYNDQMVIDFPVNGTYRNYEHHDHRLGIRRVTLHKGYIQLNKAILLRPNYNYVIAMSFKNEDYRYALNGNLATKVRVDHDIVIKFHNRGVITQLILSRFDRKTYLQKIVHNPKTWILASMVGVSLYFFRN